MSPLLAFGRWAFASDRRALALLALTLPLAWVLSPTLGPFAL